MKMPSHILTLSALFAAIVVLCPQAQHARSLRASSIPGADSPKAVLCGPGLVFKCTSKGCFCVKP